MPKTIAPTRSQLGEQRDALNIQRIRAATWHESLLSRARAAIAEVEALRREGHDPERVPTVGEVFPANVQGAVRMGGGVRYHTAPEPEEIAAAEQEAARARAAHEDVCRKLDVTPPDDPLAAAELAGCRYSAGRAFTWRDRGFYAGEPVAVADLDGCDGAKLNALIKGGTLRDVRPFAHLIEGAKK